VAEDAVARLRELGVVPELLALLPDDLPFVLKPSRGTRGNLPPVAGSATSTAALYVGRTCLWVALDPEDAQRYSALTGVRIAAPRGNVTTWRLIVHAEDARRPDAARTLREAVALAVRRSLDRPSRGAPRRP
jgi:hypothetical protein